MGFDGRCRAGLMLLGLLLGSPAARADEPSSVSFRLVQSTQSSAGETSQSASFRLDGSLGQEVTIGASAAPQFVLQSGFWSFLGSGVVPVVLTVERNADQPGNVDLSWSGNNAPYEVFRSEDCGDVFSGFFGMTSTNAFDNLTPPTATLICFNVLPTAPGPK